MTIPEACQLVLEAGFMGNGGQIFVFDMGKPVKVLDVALNLIRFQVSNHIRILKLNSSDYVPVKNFMKNSFQQMNQCYQTYHPKITIAQVAENDFETVLIRDR